LTCIIAHSDLGDLLTKRQQLKQRSVWQMDPGLMGARILIVDDEEIVIKSWLRILGGGDYQIDTAYDGREALRKIEENHYDVMILDVVMPNMGGLEVLRRVKKTHPDMDVIMVTGLALVHTVVQARRLGARDFISKPFEPDELKLVVQRALERQ
jgi:DNA-binding NtrC family response regulator